MSTSRTPEVTEESKYGYFEIFNDKSVTKVYHNLVNHNPNKKYDSKIALKVVDTIVLDNGQFMFWTFTDKSGYVMKKSMKKLNRDYLINYLMDYINNHLEKAENIITKKTSSQLLWEVNKYAQMLLERKKDNNARIFTEFENKYLDILNNLRFILMHYSPTDKRFFNIYQFKEVLDDNSLLANVNMIQFYFYANFKYRPLICKYTRKSALEEKKFFLFSENPIKKGF